MIELRHLSALSLILLALPCASCSNSRQTGDGNADAQAVASQPEPSEPEPSEPEPSPEDSTLSAGGSSALMPASMDGVITTPEADPMVEPAPNPEPELQETQEGDSGAEWEPAPDASMAADFVPEPALEPVPEPAADASVSTEPASVLEPVADASVSTEPAPEPVPDAGLEPEGAPDAAGSCGDGSPIASSGCFPSCVADLQNLCMPTTGGCAYSEDLADTCWCDGTRLRSEGSLDGWRNDVFGEDGALCYSVVAEYDEDFEEEIVWLDAAGDVVATGQTSDYGAILTVQCDGESYPPIYQYEEPACTHYSSGVPTEYCENTELSCQVD